MFQARTNLIVGCAVITMGLMVFEVMSAHENPIGTELSDVFTPDQLVKLGVDDYQKATSSIAGRPFFNPSEVIPTEERLAEFLVNFCGVSKDAFLAFSELTKAGKVYSAYKLKDHNDPCQVGSYEDQLISEESFYELGNDRSLTKDIQWKEFQNLRDTENFKIDVKLYFNEKNEIRVLNVVSRERVQTRLHRMLMDLSQKYDAEWDLKLVYHLD